MSHRRACDLTQEDRAEIIRDSEIGPSLDPETLARLAAASTAVDARRRRFIYRAGDAADSLFVIESGRVKICSMDAETGREAVIDIIGPGALFGESSLYSAGVREKCALAYENARLLQIPAGEFREAMGASRGLYDYTFRMLGQRLTRAERRVADFALDAIPARLDKLLAEMSERYGQPSPGGVLIDLPLPHREIASIVGSTRESVTVRLNALKRAGIIDFVDRKILIKTPAATTAAV
ncbi:MAG TPA: Crp/Fnr family transcriptional regulator [Pyrinomonadaceae bacterium]|nr:Crp/Fnr family transcriptional regulator [Pyrinomonadaceae bacterium]